MRVLDITDHLPLVMSDGVSLRVPYMKRVRGSLRVLLFFCSSSQTYSPPRVTHWVPLWGDLESFPQVLPGVVSACRMRVWAVFRIIDPW